MNPLAHNYTFLVWASWNSHCFEIQVLHILRVLLIACPSQPLNNNAGIETKQPKAQKLLMNITRVQLGLHCVIKALKPYFMFQRQIICGRFLYTPNICVTALKVSGDNKCALRKTTDDSLKRDIYSNVSQFQVLTSALDIFMAYVSVD